jgi:serine protease Do
MDVNRSSISRKLSGRARALVFAMALALAPGAGLLTGGVAFGQQSQLPSPAQLSRTFVEVAKQVKPAVVHVEVEQQSRQSSMRMPEGFPQIPGFPPFGGAQPRRQRGSGSGVIISQDGYILTNNHVAGEADQIKVKLADGREMKAKLIGADPETDIAVIKVDAQGLPYAKLGDSSKLEQGEWVIALGSPFGLQQTITAGIVSATGRDIPGAGPYVNFIQTDASINPGNSGGPLVNMNGEVIGINTMIFSRSGGSEGIGFAVPSTVVSNVHAQLIKSGKVTRGYLGVLLQDVTPAIARSVGYDGEGGALVGDLAEASSPAAKAGLRSGDVIIEFDGKPIKSRRELTQVVADTPVGKAARVKYVRDGRVETATITLAERPGSNDADRQEMGGRQEPGTGKLGVSVDTVTAEVARELKLKRASGAVVMSVQPNSPAAEAGLQQGDVIHRIDRTPVATADDLIRGIRALGNQKEVVLQIERGGQLTFLTVTLE